MTVEWKLMFEQDSQSSITFIIYNDEEKQKEAMKVAFVICEVL